MALGSVLVSLTDTGSLSDWSLASSPDRCITPDHKQKRGNSVMKPLNHLQLLCCGALLAGLSAFAGETPLVSGASADAPDGLQQYGQFVGTWRCTPAFIDANGEWQTPPTRPTWVWHWVLNGTAVQDVWMPDPDTAPQAAVMGTNLRVYDPEEDRWDMVWTTETLAGFQRFTARMENDEIVMHGAIPAGQRPAHDARITFHDIQAERFEWKYEASAPGDGENWQTFSTLSCERTADR